MKFLQKLIWHEVFLFMLKKKNGKPSTPTFNKHMLKLGLEILILVSKEICMCPNHLNMYYLGDVYWHWEKAYHGNIQIFFQNIKYKFSFREAFLLLQRGKRLELYMIYNKLKYSSQVSIVFTNLWKKIKTSSKQVLFPNFYRIRSNL